MSKPIKDFKQLRVYKQAFQSAMHLFELSKSWPREEQYVLTDQIRRSSRSVCSNIAEAWFKRRYPNHFISKLSDAGTEASETLVWLDFAVECQYLKPSEVGALRNDYSAIIGGLTKMMNRPEQWCVSSERVQEELSPYLDAEM